MFKIPDELMAEWGQRITSIEDKIHEVQDEVIQLNDFITKHKIRSYTNYETVPEFQRYRKLQKKLEELVAEWKANQ
jgi:hypothetical protein